MVKKTLSPAFSWIAYFALVAVTLFTVLPLVWLFYSSLKPHSEIIKNVFALPKQFAFSNYTRAWTLGNLGVYMLNSIIYSVVASTITVYLAMSIGYAFSIFRYASSKFLYSLFLVGLLITAHAMLVPLFILESSLNIDDTRLGILLPYIAFGLPFMIYLAYSFVKGLSYSLVEAALMDGANHLSILHRITLPMSKPIVATMLIFTFLANWNEFVFVFVLTSKESLRSLPVGINAFAGGMSRNFGLLFATLVIGIVPILIFYIIFYDRIVEGIGGGAVKE